MITSNTISSLDIETNRRNENIVVNYSKVFVQREGGCRIDEKIYFIEMSEEKGKHCVNSHG